MFSSGSLKIWAGSPGTTNQGQSLSFNKDDLLLNRVTFDDELYQMLTSANQSSVLMDSSIDAVFFKGSGSWNTVKSYKLSGRAEDLAGKDLEIFNFVHADIKLHKLSTASADVTIDGAKRGSINLTNLDDALTIGISSNGSGWRNSFKINARDGDDTILIRSAIDEYQFGNSLNDSTGIYTTTTINAGRGNDTVDSSAVNTTDLIRGQDGDDIILSGGGNDRLRGGNDNDTAYGGSGADDIRGNSGNDLLVGDDGNDDLRGGAGNDVLIGDKDIRVEYNEQTLDFADLGSLSAVQAALDVAGIAIRARNILKDRDDVRLSNLEEDNVGYSNGGIGASAEAATRPSIDTETGYDPVTDLSELLEIDFEQPVNSAELTLSLFFNQNQGADSHQNEVLEYRAYRNGEVVLNGTYSALLGNILLIDGAVFDRIELEALPYNNDALNAGITNDSSDFLLTQLRYTEDDSATGDDTLRGGKGDDVLIGGNGDDYLNGGQGIDTAVFRGERSEYSIVETGNNQFTITHLNGGADATDTLRGVEFAEFSDTTVDLRNVQPVNLAPEGSDDLVDGQFIEDERLGTVVGNVLAGTYIDNIDNTTVLNNGGNDTDPNNDLLSVTEVSFNGQSTAVTGSTIINGVFGALTISPDGNYSYEVFPANLDPFADSLQQLAEGQTAEDDFAYSISDGSLNDTDIRLTFVFEGRNDIPVVINAISTQSVDEGQQTTIDLSTVFDDIDTNDNLTFTLENLSPNLLGKLSINNEILSIAPDFSDSATYSITVRADDSLATVDNTFTLNINNINRAPIAQDDSFEIFQNAQLLNENVLADNGNNSDSDPDGDAIFISEVDNADVNVGNIVNIPGGGRIKVDANGDLEIITTGNYQELNINEFRIEQLTYSLSDGSLEDTVTISVKINGLNDAPTVANALTQSRTEDDNSNITLAELLSGADDVDNDNNLLTIDDASVSITFVDGGHGITSGASYNASTKTIEWDNTAFDALDNGDVQNVIINYDIIDPIALPDQGRVSQSYTVDVNGQSNTNTAPIESAPITRQIGTGDNRKTINLLQNINDADGDPLTVSNVTLVASNPLFQNIIDTGNVLTVNNNQLIVRPGFLESLANDGDTFSVDIGYQVSDGVNPAINASANIEFINEEIFKFDFIPDFASGSIEILFNTEDTDDFFAFLNPDYEVSLTATSQGLNNQVSITQLFSTPGVFSSFNPNNQYSAVISGIAGIDTVLISDNLLQLDFNITNTKSGLNYSEEFDIPLLTKANFESFIPIAKDVITISEDTNLLNNTTVGSLNATSIFENNPNIFELSTLFSNGNYFARTTFTDALNSSTQLAFGSGANALDGIDSDIISFLDVKGQAGTTFGPFGSGNDDVIISATPDSFLNLRTDGVTTEGGLVFAGAISQADFLAEGETISLELGRNINYINTVAASDKLTINIEGLDDGPIGPGSLAFGASQSIAAFSQFDTSYVINGPFPAASAPGGSYPSRLVLELPEDYQQPTIEDIFVNINLPSSLLEDALLDPDLVDLGAGPIDLSDPSDASINNALGQGVVIIGLQILSDDPIYTSSSTSGFKSVSPADYTNPDRDLLSDFSIRASETVDFQYFYTDLDVATLIDKITPLFTDDSFFSAATKATAYAFNGANQSDFLTLAQIDSVLGNNNGVYDGPSQDVDYGVSTFSVSVAPQLIPNPFLVVVGSGADTIPPAYFNDPQNGFVDLSGAVLSVESTGTGSLSNGVSTQTFGFSGLINVGDDFL